MFSRQKSPATSRQEAIKSSLFMAVYLVFVLLVWGAFAFLPSPQTVVLEQQSGRLDLSAAPFDNTVYHYIDNRWESYPNALLVPADFLRGDLPPSTAMAPQDFQTTQYATHRMQLRLPPGQTYALSMRSSDYAMRLFVDDQELLLVGKPGDSAQSSTPAVSQVGCTFRPTGEVTTLVVQASNWVHQEGASPPNFYLGSEKSIAKYDRHSLLFTLLITGSLLTGFLYHLGLFVLNRRRKTTLLFAFCCLLLCVMSSNFYALFLPNFSWFVAFRLEYIVHFLTFATLSYFLQRMFPRLLHPLVARLYYLLALGYILTTFVFPPKVYSSLLLGFELASVGMIVYTLLRLTLQLRQRRAQNTLAFAGVLLICVFAINDLLYTNNITSLHPIAGQFFTTPIGMVFFMFCYAMVLSIEYAQTETAMQKAQTMEKTLAAENALLDHLNRLRSAFMAELSHELKTPLTVMSLNAQLSKRQMKKGIEGPAVYANLDMISQEAQRLSTMVSELMGFALLQESSSQMEPLDVSLLAEQTIGLYTALLQKNNNTLLVSLPPGLPLVVGNRDMLSQVLINLITNANNHTKDGDIGLRADVDQSFLTLSVSDTGSGIPPDLLPHVLGRLSKGEQGGAGLGLTICQEIVTLHGGELQIASTLKKGTTVSFTLPIQKGGLPDDA